MYALHQMNSAHTHPKLAQGNNPLPFARAKAVGSSLLHVAKAFLVQKIGPRVNPRGSKQGGHLKNPIVGTTTREGHTLAMTHTRDGMIKHTQ